MASSTSGSSAPHRTSPFMSSMSLWRQSTGRPSYTMGWRSRANRSVRNSRTHTRGSGQYPISSGTYARSRRCCDTLRIMDSCFVAACGPTEQECRRRSIGRRHRTEKSKVGQHVACTDTGCADLERAAGAFSTTAFMLPLRRLARSPWRQTRRWRDLGLAIRITLGSGLKTPEFGCSVTRGPTVGGIGSRPKSWRGIARRPNLDRYF
jgi:hypothetical protein